MTSKKANDDDDGGPMTTLRIRFFFFPSIFFPKLALFQFENVDLRQKNNTAACARGGTLRWSENDVEDNDNDRGGVGGADGVGDDDHDQFASVHGMF